MSVQATGLPVFVKEGKIATLATRQPSSIDMAELLHQAEVVTQTPSPLPPLPERDVLTAEQWGMLAAIADTVVPSFTSSQGNRLLQHPLRSEVYEAASRRIQQLTHVQDGAGNDLAAEYIGESATSQAEFKHNISRLLASYMDESGRNGLLFILNALK